MTNIPFIASQHAVTVYLDHITHSFSADTPEYEKTLRILYDPTLDDPARHEQLAALTTFRADAHKNRWQPVLDRHPNLSVAPDDTLLWKDLPLHPSMAQRLLKLLDDNLDVSPMINFIANVMQNPSNKVVTRLYDFLVAGRIPITSDGQFLVYKAIAPDWHSIATGANGHRPRNMVGDVVEMPRNAVDENPDQTCSYGLHVCSYDYLPHFAHANGHVVVCKVNPRDVVAIPNDYNNTKMRVCRYEVVAEVTDYYRNAENVLSRKPFADVPTNNCWDELETDDEAWDFDDLSPAAPPNIDDFNEPGRYLLYTDQSPCMHSEYGTISSALQALTDVMSDDAVTSANIYDTHTYDVIFRITR